MSEIKGQLLGIVLVVMIFGAVSVAVIAIFNNLTQKVETEVDNMFTESTSAKAINDKYKMSSFLEYK